MAAALCAPASNSVVFEQKRTWLANLVCDRLVVRPTQLLSQPNFEAWCRPVQESANFEGQEPLLRVNNIHRPRCGFERLQHDFERTRTARILQSCRTLPG